MAEIGTIIDNKYRILDQVGKGGMSRVYLARDKRLEKLWAVKEILNVGDPKKRRTLIDSLNSEARLMRDLDHAAVVRIVDIIDEKSSLFVVMDYIDGRDLTSFLYPNGKNNPAAPIEEAQAVEWGIQICEVIRYLHTQNPPVIYYDLKPDNIMIRNNEGDVRVIDFGAARKYSPDPSVMKKYKILGTIGYAAPEQYKGGAATDIRTDIYAFGVSLHFMVTGVPPKATRENRNPKLRPIRQINPQLSSGLERIIKKCTQIDPNDRYQNCDELIYALEHYHELDDQYRAKQKKTLKTFLISAVTTLGLLAFGGIFALTNTLMTGNNYDALINATGSSDNQIENAYDAIEIDNSRTEAYDRLLSLYSANGYITEAQADELDKKMNASTIGNTSDEALNLRYDIGCTYLFFLVSGVDADGNGVYSTNVSIQRAKPYFQAVHDNAGSGFENREKAEALYDLCDFYVTYVANGNSVNEADKTQYDRLIASINQAADIMPATEGVESGSSGYTKLQFYSGLLGIINDKLSGMNQTGVDKASVSEAVAKIRSKVEGINVTLSKSQTLKNTTLGFADTINTQIESLYSKSK